MSDEHVVTEHKPMWVEEQYRAMSHGSIEYVGDSSDPLGVIDDLAVCITYECSCGYEPETWDEVEAHLQEMNDG